MTNDIILAKNRIIEEQVNKLKNESKLHDKTIPISYVVAASANIMKQVNQINEIIKSKKK